MFDRELFFRARYPSLSLFLRKNFFLGQRNFRNVNCLRRHLKMNKFFCFLLIFSAMHVGFAIQANDFRALFGHWFNGNSGGVNSPCNGCPFRNCLNDRAVILGYCCGCARVSDFLPIDCPALHIHCPSDGRRLCRDYDYMLNCCC